jgi:hypothetical protein
MPCGVFTTFMYTFLKIFTVVILALALFNWLADRDRRADTNIPNATPGLSILTAHTKFGYVPAIFLPGDIKYESPNGNVRIYFPIVTSIALSVLFTLILRFIR